MADGNASLSVIALTIHQETVRAFFHAVPADALEIVRGVALFADPAINYKRNVANAQATISTTNHPVLFGTPVANYKRHLASFADALLISRSIGFGDLVTRLPPVFSAPRSYPDTLLIDVRIKYRGDQDSSSAGTRPVFPSTPSAAVTFLYKATTEIVFNIVDKLSIRPRLIAPLNGTSNRTGIPVMIWTKTSQAVYYEVHVATDINFVNRVARIDTPLTEIQRFFPFGQTYYWKVRAVAGSAYSDYSETWAFTVFPARPLTDETHDPDGRFRLLWQFRENH